MKISTPDCLELLVRPYRWRGQSRLGLSIIVAIDTRSGQAVLNSDSEIWDIAEQCFETGGAIDLGIPKVHPEYLVSGYAYTHSQDDKTRCLVGVQVNDKQKELLVIGDRYSLDGRISAPQAFEQMPLSWAHAYGGAEHPSNPVGKGAQASLVNGVRTHLMPNIEWPDDLIRHLPDQQIVPAGFGPRDITWPVRFDKVGSYSQDWLERDFPGFLPDMDPSIFNAAMDDQIWWDAQHFPSEIEFAVRAMHPSLPVWRGTVPMLAGRCLVQVQTQVDQEPVIHDVSLKLKTLWLVPHLQTYFLIYQDSIALQDEDADEVKHVLGALEWRYSPKSFEHYQDYMTQRENHDESALLAYEDAALLPENLPTKGLQPEEPVPYALMWEKQAKFKQYIRQQAQNQLEGMSLKLDDFVPEFVGPEAPLNMQALLEKQQLLNKRSLDLRTQRELIQQAAKRFKLSKGQDQEFLSLLNAQALKDKILSEQVQQQAPTELTLSPALAHLVQAQQAADPEHTQEQIQRQELAFSLSAHLRGQQFVVDNLYAQQLRQQAEQIAHDSKDFTGLNLERADLAKLVFEDCTFERCSLAYADLRETQFIRCRFKQSAFSSAQLEQTQFIECEFEQSNVHQTQWLKVSFNACQLTQLVAHDVRFEQCHLAHTIMQECVWQASEFMQCELVESRLDACIWQEGEISETQFIQCELSKAAWNEVALERNQWHDCHLYRGAFANCDWQELTWQNCHLEALAVIGEQAIQACDFLACRISSASLREQVFIECDFTQTRLENTDLSKSRFVQTSFQQADFPEAVLRRCEFDRVDFTQANLMQAIFSQSQFNQCLFVQTNFYGSDFSRTQIDAHTLEQGNYMQGIQLEPRLREA